MNNKTLKPHLCIGGCMDHGVLYSDLSRKTIRAIKAKKPWKLGEIIKERDIEFSNGDFYDTDTYELERINTPIKSFYVWRWEKLSVEQMFEALLRGYNSEKISN